MQPTVIDFHLYKVIDAVAIGSEPVALHISRTRPTAARDIVNHTSILGGDAGAVENGTGPFITVIVPIEDDVYTMSLKNWHQVSPKSSAPTAVASGAIWGMVEDN